MQGMLTQIWMKRGHPPRPPSLHPQDKPKLQLPHEQVRQHPCTAVGANGLDKLRQANATAKSFLRCWMLGGSSFYKAG